MLRFAAAGGPSNDVPEGGRSQQGGTSHAEPGAPYVAKRGIVAAMARVGPDDYWAAQSGPAKSMGF